MGRSKMLASVLQALGLYAASELAFHYFGAGPMDVLLGLHQIYDYEPPGTNETNVPWSALHQAAVDAGDSPTPIPFWTLELPMSLAQHAAILPLQYLWCLSLERWFPRRPHGAAAAPLPAANDEKSAAQLTRGGDGDGAEDNIVQRWIEQGRVLRPSISWMHVLVQWIFDLTIGSAWRSVIAVLVTSVLQRHFPWHEPSAFMGMTSVNIGMDMFHPMRLVTLIGIIIMPAHKRIIFEAGAELIWSLFLAAFLRPILPWLGSLEWVQGLLVAWRDIARDSLLYDLEEKLNATDFAAPSIEHEL